jgi:hypothetical protein
MEGLHFGQHGLIGIPVHGYSHFSGLTDTIDWQYKNYVVADFQTDSSIIADFTFYTLNYPGILFRRPNLARLSG